MIQSVNQWIVFYILTKYYQLIILIMMTNQFNILQVLAKVEVAYGNLYKRENIQLTATHTHSGPGGYFQYVMYGISTMGFHQQSLDALTTGILKVRQLYMNNANYEVPLSYDISA